ncbi:MAG TPA: hypothetical protein VHG28_02800 [Longimicrobiaceae bacterium]|nr:hypothetical protein [Longimicrobiaceae bacterium]
MAGERAESHERGPEAGSEEGPSAVPFLQAVVRQLVHPPGGGEADPARERAVAGEVLELLRMAREPPSGTGRERAAERLAADPVLLSVLFQNVDLLYEHACPGADAISLTILGALERLER